MLALEVKVFFLKFEKLLDVSSSTTARSVHAKKAKSINIIGTKLNQLEIIAAYLKALYYSRRRSKKFELSHIGLIIFFFLFLGWNEAQ